MIDAMYEERHEADEPDHSFSVIVDDHGDGEIWSTLGFQYEYVDVDRSGWEHLREMCTKAIETLDKINGKDEG